MGSIWNYKTTWPYTHVASLKGLFFYSLFKFLITLFKDLENLHKMPHEYALNFINLSENI